MDMIRYIILLTLFFWGGNSILAQTTGSLQGKITDAETEEEIGFASVLLQRDDAVLAQAETDFSGNYNFSNIEAGTYDLLVTYFGYPTTKIEGVIISVGKTISLDVQLKEFIDAFGDSTEIVVIGYRIALIEPDNTTGGQTLGSEDIKTLATRDITSISATTAGVNQADEGEDLNTNGSRSSSNATYVDGILVIGGLGISEADIDQVQIITSGVPAQFGDATGSITNIITKGPSSELKIGVQAETSHFLDAFSANRVDLYVSGPIIAKPMISATGDTLKKDGRVRKKSILGYRLSGFYSSTLDDRPSALGSFKLKDATLNNLLRNPLMNNPNGLGTVYTSDFLTKDDLEVTSVRPNAASASGVLNGKIDYRPSKDFFLVVGAQAQFASGKFASGLDRLFNYNLNPNYSQNNWRVSGRFRHTISATKVNTDAEEEEGDSTIKLQPVFQNFSYELQGSYSQSNAKREDPRHKDNLWNYGYVGKFIESRTPVAGAIDTTYVLNTIGDTIGTNVEIGHAFYNNSFDRYEPNWNINPGLAAYNQLIDPSTIGPNSTGAFQTSILGMELINGLNTGGRTSTYGLYNSPNIVGGSSGASFAKTNSEQIRANVQANFDLVTNQASGDPIRHSVQLGGTFEQRIERSYSISPFSLWNLAYQTTNNHISNATDPSRPTGTTFTDGQRQYNMYQSLIREDQEGNEVQQSVFASNLRKALNLDKRDWVSVHSLSPDQMQLSWFEASTLITGRQRVLEYYGYDYLGNPLGTNVDFFEFFTAKETVNGREVKTRPIAPNKPIYAAGYIQDKFTYKDIICNIGLRFDSYDANTQVLRDPYSITGYENAAEFESNKSLYSAGHAADYKRPSSIGDDFAVYVNNNTEDATVVGYRDPVTETWYNSQGSEVNTPGELGSTIIPALKGFGTASVTPQGENYNAKAAFRDYTPTLIIMPRLGFSFPISKDANFYANYDILSMRPPNGALATPYTYYNFTELATSTTASRFIPNANLKPQRTINYEVGFQQKLTDFSKFKVSILYREERDLIQIRQYVKAYPLTYSTYGNSDFSTTKSFKLEYDLREHNNIRVLANYTLSFSEGTGSSPTSSVGIAAKELKYVFPLSFDQRHTFYLMMDYRYKSGDKYNGPKIGKFDVLENTGLNIAFNASSGRPYTRKEIPGGIGTSFSSRITDGSINGARMPWSFRMDLRLDRDITIGKKGKKQLKINVYLRVQNVLNTQNVMAVYPTTGSPTDDGFLTASGSPGPGFLASQPASYQTLYNLRMINPYNISRPRRIFLGARFSF